MKQFYVLFFTCLSFISFGQGSDVEVLPFITTWKTDNPGTSNDNQITIPTFEGEIYNYSVDWGDGTSDTGITGDIIHTYDLEGVYRVSISGMFPRIFFTDRFDDNDKIIQVNQWGDNQWKSMVSAFSMCRNLDIIANDVPDLSNVTSMRGMFSGCISFIGNSSFADWDVSTINDMGGLFSGASVFNQDIGNWDVSNVIIMFNMFNTASAFNSDIGNWDVSAVTSMSSMFFRATSFNQDIGNWNVSGVTDMSNMFFDVFLSLDNYDALLKGWSNLPTLQPNLQFNGGNSNFCEAEQERQQLLDTYGWSITDEGINCVPPEEPIITEFLLIDATKDEVIMPLSEGQIIYMGDLPTTNLNIQAVASDNVGSVQMILSEEFTIKSRRIKNTIPYSLFGNFEEDFDGRIFSNGLYTISAKPFLLNDLQGKEGAELTINFKIVEGATSGVPTVTGFSAINEQLSLLTDLEDGGRYTNDPFTETFGYPDVVAVMVNTAGNVGSVRIETSGPVERAQRTQIENIPIYTAFGDNGRDFNGFPHPAGFYTITATPYSQDNLQGVQGEPLTITFEIFNACQEAIEASFVDITNVSVAGGNDGSATLNTTLLSFEELRWSHDPDLRTRTATGLTAGTYIVGFGNHNCTYRITFEITEPEKPIGFTVVNAENDTIILTLTDGMEISSETIAGIPLGILFNPNSDSGSIHFRLDGPINTRRTERIAPFSLFGDIDADIRGRVFPAGEYQLVADPEIGETATINFKIIEASPKVTGFTLITGLGEGDIIVPNLEDGGRYANDTFSGEFGNSDGSVVIANTLGSVGSVLIETTGPIDNSQIANEPPFSAFGGDESCPNLFPSTAGFYTITAMPYSEDDLQGVQGEPLTITFEIFNACQEAGEASFVDITNVSVAGGNDGSATLNTTLSLEELRWSHDSDLRTRTVTGLTAGTYTVGFGKGNQGCISRITFEITEPEPTLPKVTGFTLVNAETDEDIMILTDGVAINPLSLPTAQLNIRAMGTNDIKSMQMVLRGALNGTRTENAVPFALFGDIAGDYRGRVMPEGSYTLTAIPFLGSNGTGDAGTPLTVGFSITSELAVLPAREPVNYEVSLYPNSAVDEVNITVSDSNVKITHIVVHDMLGRKVAQYAPSDVKNGGDYLLPLYQMQGGMYLVITTDDNGGMSQMRLMVDKR